RQRRVPAGRRLPGAGRACAGRVLVPGRKRDGRRATRPAGGGHRQTDYRANPEADVESLAPAPPVYSIMKVSIIGGGGRVGSNAAFALQCAGIVSEIQILDANAELAAGEALDLLHGTSSIADQRIYAGDYTRASDSDVFVITAGLRRKPDESRLDLINRNVALF